MPADVASTSLGGLGGEFVCCVLLGSQDGAGGEQRNENSAKKVHYGILLLSFPQVAVRAILQIWIVELR